MTRSFFLLAAIALLCLGCPNNSQNRPPDAGSAPDAGSSSTTDAGPADAGSVSSVPAEVITEFERHYQAWRVFADSSEMRLTSDTAQLTNHPEYTAMVAMGKKVLPLVMAKLAEGDFLMVSAAERITRVDVVRASGKTLQPEELFGEQDEARLWVEWWRQHQNDPEWRP